VVVVVGGCRWDEKGAHEDATPMTERCSSRRVRLLLQLDLFGVHPKLEPAAAHTA
jgi:hypothetical protein